MTPQPKIDGKPLGLDPEELSHSFAIHPDDRRFLLGAQANLYAFDCRRQAALEKRGPGRRVGDQHHR